jgi:hypothetical protein
MTDYKSAIIFLILGIALSAFPIYVINRGLRLSGVIMLIAALGFFPAAYGSYVGNNTWIEIGIFQFFIALLVRIVFAKRLLEYDRRQM